MFGRFYAYNKLDTQILKPNNEPDQKHQRFIILGWLGQLSTIMT